MSDDDGVRVPDWPEGTACVLATGGGAAHAIPVSTAVRLSDTTVAFGLGKRRESLARIEQDQRVALCVMAGPDTAFTLTGRAEVADDDVEGVVAVRLHVEAVDDHMTPDFEIRAGVDWHWTDERAASKDDAVRSGLRHLDD